MDALRENRIILYAQAIVSLSSSPRVDESFEVLARLRKRDGILLPPSKFIPAAERFGLMVALDRYVIDHCFSLLQHSDHSSGALLSINVSAQSISDPSLLSFVVNGLMRSGIAPARICFEITETAAINSFRAAADFVNGVRALGCRVSLDDFGSGLSSFSYLKNFSIDYLKIDGQFIREIANCEIDSAICRSVADICRNLDISVVAECVEDAASVAILQDIGVGFAQGYHFHRPCSLEGILNSKTGVLGEKSNTALAEQHTLGR
ncbi:EAL domain-containing protein [Aurantimonas sp. A2-1-M11]|uniref:EAL domain-containing protein n=1 Tax=Aurantimonas sp. A2-1-M11 TaxID=3113712 RepID=UPI002F92F2D3